MHYHLEIIMPPTGDVEAAVTQILKPFDESGRDEDGNSNTHTFWDWWVIGGRWAGAKFEAQIGQDSITNFRATLRELKVTISGLQAGKPTLDPSEQIPIVDALWNEMFPDSPVKVCPLFSHFNNQYAKVSDSYGDIMRLGDMPPDLKASHVIIASSSYMDDGTLEAKYMTQESIWNGVCHLDTKWDGKVLTAINEYRESLRNAKPEYAAKHVPKDDWLVVTVDYHS